MHRLRRYTGPPPSSLDPLFTLANKSPSHPAGGLDNSVTKSTLQEAFLPFGEILEINIPSDDRSTEPHRGFGYVEFESQEDSAAAIDNMDQAMLAGRVLSVAQAKPQKEPGNVLGSKVAVWEQVGNKTLSRLWRKRIVTDWASAGGLDPEVRSVRGGQGCGGNGQGGGDGQRHGGSDAGTGRVGCGRSSAGKGMIWIGLHSFAMEGAREVHK
jgi:hypothetical protein